MPLNPQSALYARVWALLEAHAPFTSAVRPANRYKMSRPRESERSGERNGPADHPKVYCGTPDRSAGRGGYVPMNDKPANVDMGVPLSLNVDIDIVHDQTTIDAQSPVESAVANALLAEGRTLGLAWATSSELTRVSRRDEPNGGTVRTVVRLRLAVTARPLRSLLINP